MKQYTKYFAENPYPYKSDSENRSIDDSKFLQEVFGKTQDQVLAASRKYKNNSEGLRSFIFVLRNYEHLRKSELSLAATSLAVAIIIFTIEGVMSSQKKRKHSKSSESELRLSRFLIKYLTKQQKLLLLNAFVFSSRANNSIPVRPGTERHLMYKGMLHNCESDEFEDFHSEWCSAQESTENTHCGCIQWLSTLDEKEANKYIKRLANHLYKMRCSIVHDGIAPLISHTEEKPAGAAIWGMTVSDVYFNNKQSRHYRYNSAMSRAKFEELFLLSMWQAFQDGRPTRKLMNEHFRT